LTECDDPVVSLVCFVVYFALKYQQLMRKIVTMPGLALCGLAVCALPALVRCQALQGLELDSSGKFRLTMQGASHFVGLALKCTVQPYPNKPGNTIESDSDILGPQRLHPAFYGCYDWHSTVHGHWMMVRLLRLFPALPEGTRIRAVLDQNLTAANIIAERDYFARTVNKSYERTYGWAWLLKLSQELHGWDDPDARRWEKNLQPLTDLIVQRYLEFLPKQTYPIRQGMHPNTAFGLVMAYDYAKALANDSLLRTVVKRSKDYYLQDTSASLAWEPNGADFLSPSLVEADLMRRVLSPPDFMRWFNRFLKDLVVRHPKNILEPATVSDRTDLQIVHLDGLNLSRAWCMMGIARTLGPHHPFYNTLMRSAALHLRSALPNIANGNYGGEHWLASFAVYALAEE
jgi:hypothetical protein